MTGHSDAPLVSAVVITYNHVKYIEDALTSVLAQEMTAPWEVIIADDDSTDGTRAYSDRIALANPHVRVLGHTNNLGAQGNLRRALSSASGEFVALLEGDDFWTDPTKLSRQTDYLRKRTGLAGVAHRTVVHATDGRERTLPSLPGHLDVRAAVLGPRPHFSSLVYRRSALPTTPPWFDSFIAADSLMFAIIASRGGVDVIDRDMSAYRISDESAWRPLPAFRRQLDSIGRLEALAAHTDIMDPELRDLAFRRTYGSLYSGLTRSRPFRLAADHLIEVISRDPRRASRYFGTWIADQSVKRVMAARRP